MNDYFINPLQPYTSAVSDWQVVFQRAGEQSMPMNVSEARKQGYWFDLMDERLVFRTPYGQPDSFSTEVNTNTSLNYWMWKTLNPT